MLKRALCVLALLAAAVLPAGAAAAATPGTEGSAATAQVDALLNDFNGSTFDFPSTGGTCPMLNQGGNCWWWAANAWMALITWADENPSAPERATLRADLNKAYTSICGNNGGGTWGPCASGPDQSNKDPFTINTNGATYFDDIGWWTTTWLAAFKFTGNQDYLNLAEELWNYTTGNGYHWDFDTQGQTANEGVGCGGMVQYHNPNHTAPQPVIGPEDTFANALYLRNSAWLWSITDGAPFSAQYLTGTTVSWKNGLVGGAIAAAAWIRQHLIFQYNSTTLGTSGARFMMAGQVDGSCGPTGNQTFLHAQGAMVSAWTGLADACGLSGSGCSATPGYYNSLAEELARSVVSDKIQPDGSFPFQNPPTGALGQKEPTVNSDGILSEMCISSIWPRGCDTGSGSGPFASYLIAKGISQRALYCVQSNVTDATLANFAQANAASLANTVVHYGFLWDSAQANDPVNFATRASDLEGLDAGLGQQEADSGQPHYGMC